jgi:hypothetical protein
MYELVIANGGHVGRHNISPRNGVEAAWQISDAIQPELVNWKVSGFKHVGRASSHLP